MTPARSIMTRARTPRNRPDECERHETGHGWLMIACCIPTLVIAVALVATGIASPGFLFFAVACTAMLARMMWGMDSDHDAHR